MKYLKTYENIFHKKLSDFIDQYDPYIEKLEVINEDLYSLEGIKKFTKLKILFCASNKLTELDLEGMTSLEYVSCYDNRLTKLNLKGLINLKILNCEDNKLKEIDLSDSPNMEQLYCPDNKLTKIIVDPFKLNASFYTARNRLPYGPDLEDYIEWYSNEYPEKIEARKFNF